MRLVRPSGLLGALLLLAVAAGAALTSCASEARGVETCRKIEAARCERGPECVIGFVGDPDSCKRFYDVQCGRGGNDGYRDPSTQELNDCLTAIKSSCDIVNDPMKSPACRFLNANAPDTGILPDTSAEAATDGVAEVATDAGPEVATDTGTAPTDTAPTDTGTAPTDTAPTDTAPTDTGTAPADTGTADGADAD